MNSNQNKQKEGTSLAVQWLGLHASTAGGSGSITGWGTDPPGCAAQPKKKRINIKRSTNRLIILKMLKVKDKEKTVKAAREKQLVTYKGTPVTDDISAEQRRTEAVR